MANFVRKWAAEPLVQFLLAGMVIFAASLAFGGPVDDADRTVVIDEGQTERLAAGFVQTWRRAPTPDELDGLIREYIREEIYYREAKRLGLDIDDTIIRRRLRSKMEFLAEAEAEAAKPDEDQLQAWFDQRRDRYAAEVHYSFDQMYIDPTKPGTPASRAAELKQQLAGGTDWTTLGDPVSLPAQVERRERTGVSRDFGDVFAAGLDELETGEWVGPVASGFGAHLVRLRARDVSAPPRLADVRQQVENDWRSETIKARQDAAFATLLANYDVRIEVE